MELIYIEMCLALITARKSSAIKLKSHCQPWGKILD